METLLGALERAVGESKDRRSGNVIMSVPVALEIIAALKAQGGEPPAPNRPSTPCCGNRGCGEPATVFFCSKHYGEQALD
jgi:hypothetical protein